MRGMSKGFELILVTIFANVAAKVVIGARSYRASFARFNRLRRTAGCEPHDSCS
ncbi:MAG TPA: hypothetical protein VFV61_02975 [Pyrinomonadaceae bacterium]|nr:hypothetical protein [Pyrinomonadaceae bacterium]